MKRLILLAILITSSLSTFASHVIGGEITWTCLSNGQYVFNMTVYRDCTGIPYTYQNETIGINGNPLPTNSITNILIQPDSSRWTNTNNGDITPTCTSNYGTAYTCSGGDAGSVQAFYYASAPITLIGVPPNSGWDFYWQAPCCRPGNLENVNSSGAMMLKASMFPTIQRDSVNFCYDSSPIFGDTPQMLVCRGQEFVYNNVVIDADADSIAYSWGTPINPPISAPIPLTYKPGFSGINPTPGTSFNIQNVPSIINSETGGIRLAVFSGNGVKKYAKVLNVDSWRGGVRISRVSREIPVSFIDCPPLPAGHVNNLPIFSMALPKDANGVYRDTVTVGTYINHPINIVDSNNNGVGTGIQMLSIRPVGHRFSQDFSDSTFCLSVGDTSCVTLSPPPSLNSTGFPPQFEYTAMGFLSTNLKWRPDCNHLKANGQARTHYFIFRYTDDHCPIPLINYQAIAIRVEPSAQPCNVLTTVESLDNFTNEVRLYPNPTNGNVNLQLERDYQLLSVNVRNIHGQLVNKLQYTSQRRIELALKGEAGIYFIELMNENGEKVNLKVIKK